MSLLLLHQGYSAAGGVDLQASRGIFAHMQLPQHILPLIWVLSDADRDGRLNRRVGAWSNFTFGLESMSSWLHFAIVRLRHGQPEKTCVSLLDLALQTLYVANGPTNTGLTWSRYCPFRSCACSCTCCGWPNGARRCR